MECGDTPHFVISIWIQIWIWIWSVGLHGVLLHPTLSHIHMDIDMAPCSHSISVTNFAYQNKSIQNSYHIIYHNSRILNMNFEI